MPTNEYRWGFVGAGSMARHQAQDLAFSPRNRAGGVVARTLESAQAFGRDFGAKVFLSLEAMLADDEIDLIYISTPNNLHHSQAKLALQAGKPVLCEKPFTLNATELNELIQIARAKKTFLMEAMWVRYLPIIAKLRDLLASKSIGVVQSLEASFHLKLPVNPAGRIYNLALGGGSLLDLGIYPISFASLVFAKPPMKIESEAAFADTGVDTHFQATLDYGDSRAARVSAAVDGESAADILISGSAGTLRVMAQRTWKWDHLLLQTAGASHAFDLPIAGSGYSYQADEVARCLDAGLLESAIMPLGESLAIMQTLDTIRAQWGLVYPGEK